MGSSSHSRQSPSPATILQIQRFFRCLKRFSEGTFVTWMNVAFGAVLMEEKSMQNSSLAQFTTLDRQAFQSFYRENLGPIYRYVYNKVGNREEAEDLTSQIFIKAVCNLDYERNPQSIRNWLFQVARTTIADYWRSFYRTATSSLDALLEAGWEATTEDELLETGIRTEEHVQCILQELPERYRDILTCRFLLDLSIRETAVKMGLTEGNVKTLQYRALKRAAAIEQIGSDK